MKYVAPYGIGDPDASYINGDPSVARQGSIPPAAAFENPMRELVHIISDSMLSPDDGDLEQCAKGIRSQRMNFVQDTGSINVLSVALSPPLGGYTLGLPLRVKIYQTNTGPTTIDAGAGRVPVRKPSGAEMAAGDLPGGGLAELVYDGTVFQMINFAGAAAAGGGGDIFLTNIPYTVDTSPTANTVIANFSPAITSLSAGFICMVKIANTTTGTTANINVNGLGLKPVKAQGGHPSWPLLAGDMAVGDVLVFVYDGTSFWVYPSNAINQAVTFNVATVTDINSLFVALARKRISAAGSVLIQLAAGNYTAPIVTYHADADRITLQGTMNGAVPVSANFHQSGSDAGSRAQDSSLNIQMCRARYKSEVKFTNAQPFAMQHNGPGLITYKNILVTGSNTPVSGTQDCDAILVANFSSLQCIGVTVWGSGEIAFAANAGYMTCDNCHASGNMSDGFNCAAQGGLTILRGGAYGNGGNGVLCSSNGMVWATPEFNDSVGPYFTCNASSGVFAEQSTININYATVIANPTDVIAADMGAVLNNASLASTWTPDINTVGNLNSIYRVY